MLYTTNILVASLAILGIVNSERNPLSNKAVLGYESPTPAEFRIYETPVDVSSVGNRMRGRTDADHAVRIALAYLKERHEIPTENIRVISAHTNEDTGVSHVYAQQTAGGVDVLNSVANINIDEFGRVISSSQAFAPTQQVRKALRLGHGRLTARSNQFASLKLALKSLSMQFRSEMSDAALEMVHISEAESEKGRAPKLTITGVPTEIAVNGTVTAQHAIARQSNGSLAFVWDFMVAQVDHSWSARINKATGEVESLIDRRIRYGPYVQPEDGDKEGAIELRAVMNGDTSALQRRFTYRVVPIMRQDPTQGFANVVNPEQATPASPLGWVSGTSTLGNNAIAYKGDFSGVSNQTSTGAFVYVQDPRQEPRIDANVNAAIVNTFYVVNAFHDITYLYGFTEAAYNFQENNFGKGGVGNDRIQASIQDSSGTNRADFFTPPDGQSGELRLFLFTFSNPYRDAALANDVISHLYAMGMADRLVGGGTASCLQSLESTGLREGWGDAVAEWLEQTALVPDFTTGRYVSNNPRGVRHYPYSRSRQVNPLTYSNLGGLSDEHDIGEVWANTLHNVLAALVDNYGWSNTALTNPTGPRGNVVFMHLLIDGMMIVPCNPTFIQARNGFIQADQNRYNGAYACTLWRAFASRGLGYNAANYRDDFSVPAGC